MNSKLLGAAAATLALAAAAGAHAQTHRGASRSGASTSSPPSSSASAQVPLTQGPPIAGMCIYSNAEVLQSSTVGKAYAERMQQLRSQAAAEISGQETQLQTEEKALVAKRATLTQDQFAKEAQPFAGREQQLNQTAELRSRELQATAVRQQQRLGVMIEPLVRTAYEGHHCSILINGDGVMAANSAMDLSEEVKTALNGKISTITFDRETAPQQ